MAKRISSISKIPAILSIPEKISSVWAYLMRLRLPMERNFSGRDCILLIAAAFLLALSLVFKRVAAFKLIACFGTVFLCLIPIGTDAFHIVKRRRIPYEEAAITLAAALAVIQREFFAASLFMLFVLLLRLAQGYALLHREAELDRIDDEKPLFFKSLSAWNVEKSRHGAVILSCCFAIFVLFVLLGIVYLILLLFHLDEPHRWLHGAMISMALASPAAGYYSSFLIHFGTACSAAKADILFSDDRVPEDYRSCKVFAFSKTGTVTDGTYVISEIAPVGITEEELLKIAAVAECKSEHPIATALKQAAGLQKADGLKDLITVEEIPGKGISTFYAGHQIYVGNGSLLDEHGIWFAVPSKSGSATHIAVDNSYRGYIMISDNIRDNAFDALEELREAGASTLVMLTGDVRSTARALASSLNFDMVKPELTPTEKAAAVKYLRSVHGDNARIVCVGDGIQDAEMFQESDISVCLAAKEDVNAEVKIYSGDILAIPKSFRICRNAAKMLIGSLSVLLTVKLLLLVLGVFAVIPASFILIADSLTGTVITVYSLLSLHID